MKKITDLEPQLANCRDYWLGWGEAGRADGDLTYYRSGLADSRLNGVLRLRSGEVGHALARARSGLDGVPWLWWVGPDSAPGVADRLLEQGAGSLGAMLVAAAVEAGRQRGLRIGTLQASGLGASVYARLGFEKVAEYRLFQPPAS